MSKQNLAQRGFGIVEIIIAIVVVVIIGFVAWRFYEGTKTQPESTTGDTSQTEQAPEVKTNADLQKAEEFVSDIDVDRRLDTGEIDTALKE